MPDETKDTSTVSNVPDQAAPQDAGQPSPESATTDQAMAQATPTQAPNPESATADQAMAQARPSQPNQSKQPNPAQPSNADIHQSLFRKIFEGMAGGPIVTTQTDPTTGKVTRQVQHRSGKNIASSIVAGAIAGMLGGLQSPDKMNDQGRRDLSGAAAGGAQAAQAVQEAPQKQQQALNDKRTAAAIAATDHNLKTHAAVLNNMKLQGDVMQSAVDDASPIITAMNDAQAGLPNAQLIKKQGVTEDELQKMMADGSAHVTRDSVVPDGLVDVYDNEGKQVMNPDGTPKKVYTYTIYDHDGAVAMTDSIREKNPELVSVPNGQALPVKVLAKLATQRNQIENAQGFVTDFQKRLAKLTDDKNFTPIDFKAEIQKDPILKGLTPILGRYAGMEPDKALAAMRQDKIDPNLIGRFQKLLGIDETQLGEIRAQTERKERIAEDEAKAQKQSDITLQREKDLANYKKANGLADTTDVVSNTNSFPNEWVDPKTNNHWNLTDPVINTVEGNEDPSQMSKRSTKDQYKQDLKMANVYSFARYGKPFDPAQASIDYKEAQNQGVRSTLRYLGSLTGSDGKSGNLGELVERAKEFGPTSFKSVNDVKTWINQHANEPEAVRYGTALVETADQVAKILQGGGSGSGSTDAKLQQAMELFNKGFSGSQIAAVADEVRKLLNNRSVELIKGNRYLQKQFGAGGSNGPAATIDSKSHKDQVLDAITMPDGSKPKDIKFGKNGAIIGWSGKAGDGWVTITPGVKP